MLGGRIVAELARSEATRRELGRHMTGAVGDDSGVRAGGAA
jgi:hypothetical protein